MSGRIKSKKVLFLIRLIFFFLLFYVLWYFLSPVYNHILATPSVLILKLSEIGGKHITNSMQVQGKHIFVHHVVSEKNPDLTVRIKSRVLHFDMVLLFALIWAVPHISWKKRFKIFLLGFAIIFVLHLFKILFSSNVSILSISKLVAFPIGRHFNRKPTTIWVISSYWLSIKSFRF